MEFEIFDKRSLIPLSVEKRGRGSQSRITLNFPMKSRNFFSFYQSRVRYRRSDYNANFTLSTMKASRKGKLCRFNHRNASANILPRKWQLLAKIKVVTRDSVCIRRARNK